jgi:hypothetical protein
MRALSGLFVVALAVPLAGCFSVTAPKEVPSWAMSSQAQPSEEPRAPVARRAPRQRVAQEQTDSVAMPIQTDNAAMPTNTVRPRVRTLSQPTQGSGPTAYSAEWHAQEEAADAQLRRRMNICTGC